MEGDAETQQSGSTDEQIINDAMKYKKPNWLFIAALVLVSIGAVGLQVLGLVLEGEWTSTLYFWSVGFDPELWAKAGGVALAGVVAVLAVAKASVEVYATYRHTTNVTNHHHHSIPQIGGIEKVEAAIGRLPSTDDVRTLMLEHRDATKLDRVEVDKDGIATLLKQGDVIKELTAAGGLQRITFLEGKLAEVLAEKQRDANTWSAERLGLQGQLDSQSKKITGLETAKSQLDRQFAAVTEANNIATNDIAKLRAELASINHVLGVGSEFMKDWSGVTAQAAKFADALSKVKPSAA